MKLQRRTSVPLLCLAATTKLAGINAILSYINNIFGSAGFSHISNDQQAIVIGATNFV